MYVTTMSKLAEAFAARNGNDTANSSALDTENHITSHTAHAESEAEHRRLTPYLWLQGSDLS